jgi:hypothetical protein
MNLSCIKDLAISLNMSVRFEKDGSACLKNNFLSLTLRESKTYVVGYRDKHATELEVSVNRNDEWIGLVTLIAIDVHDVQFVLLEYIRRYNKSVTNAEDKLVLKS